MEFWLKADGALKQIDVSESEEKVAAAEYRVKEVQVEMAAEAIEKRQIKSPIDGIVVKVERHLGEWVQPGDPVFQVVSLDKLRVYGEFGDGRPRSVDRNGQAGHRRGDALPTAGRSDSKGRVVFVDPMVQYQNTY